MGGGGENPLAPYSKRFPTAPLLYGLLAYLNPATLHNFCTVFALFCPFIP